MFFNFESSVIALNFLIRLEFSVIYLSVLYNLYFVTEKLGWIVFL